MFKLLFTKLYRRLGSLHSSAGITSLCFGFWYVSYEDEDIDERDADWLLKTSVSFYWFSSKEKTLTLYCLRCWFDCEGVKEEIVKSWVRSGRKQDFSVSFGWNINETICFLIWYILDGVLTCVLTFVKVDPGLLVRLHGLTKW